MNEDIRISPLGNFAISLYNEGITVEEFDPQLLKPYESSLVTAHDICRISKEIYAKALICSHEQDKLDIALKEIQLEYDLLSKNTEQATNSVSKEFLERKNKLQIDYKFAAKEFRETTNDWIYNFGSRPGRHAQNKKHKFVKRRAIYHCMRVDVTAISELSKMLSGIKDVEYERNNIFLYSMIYSIGGLLNAKYNTNRAEATLSEFLYEVLNRISPTRIQTEVPPFDFKKHTLYIYRGMIGCFKNKHHLAGVNAIVPTANGVEVLLNAAYCADCDRFYISYSEYMYYLDKYKSLLTKFVLTDSILSDRVFGKLADKSPLRLCGYSASQEKGLSKEEREHILCEMISSGIVSKPEVMQYLEWFIHLNGKREINQVAKEKWKSDLNYVRNLNIEYQTNWKIDAIKQYRR